MHTIYHTKAVILKSVPAGEANKRYWLFTEELGLVVAVAQGVRKHGAKLQGQLIDYSFITVDLVKGREVWRLVSAIEDYNPLASKVLSPLARAYVRTLVAIERFLGGEGEAHSELFHHIESCARFLQDTPSDTDAKAFDALAIWRTLAHLGYIAVPSEQTALFTAPFADIIATLSAAMIKTLIKEANDAIVQTHL